MRNTFLVAVVGAFLLLVALPRPSFAAVGPAATPGEIVNADVPPNQGEDCVDDPDLHPGTGLRECPKGFEVGSVLPFVAIGVGLLLGIGVAWFLVMRRRASRPFLPDPALAGASAGPGGSTGSGDWWTCRTCGSTNMIGTARCYSCGSLQR